MMGLSALFLSRLKSIRFIPEHLKQYFIKSALAFVRLLVAIKPLVLAFFMLLATPFLLIGRFIVNAVIVPMYRYSYGIRKNIARLYKPARNRFMFFVTNRFSVHIAITLIALLIVGMNLQTATVRAETFGEKSLMFQLVAQQDSFLIEETRASAEELQRVNVNYKQPTALTAITRGTDAITGSGSVLGGGALSATPITEGSASVAPRTEIETYIVQSGDTISTIAQKFNLSVNTVLWANDLTVRSILRPGDSVTILPISGLQHTVKSGDTIAKIAKTYSSTEEDILAFNKLESGNDIKIGEALLIPGGQKPAPVPVRVVPPRVIAQAPSGTTSSTTQTVQSNVTGSGSMVWPTDLRLITQYYGWSHTGLDIDCHFDHNNYAADDGIVQFTGWKGGYGYTVEVNHGNGIVTRYAHHAKIYVSNGDAVTKGQAVGLCGTSGRSTGTHLHFEVIVNGKFRNPLEYIR